MTAHKQKQIEPPKPSNIAGGRTNSRRARLHAGPLRATSQTQGAPASATNPNPHLLPSQNGNLAAQPPRIASPIPQNPPISNQCTPRIAFAPNHTKQKPAHISNRNKNATFYIKIHAARHSGVNSRATLPGSSIRSRITRPTNADQSCRCHRNLHRDVPDGN
jgi:hypothetical protein